MRRRTCLKAMAAISAGGARSLAASRRPIQLHCDLEVGPARERQMLETFHGAFAPAMRRQPGFVDVKLLKFRKPVAGEPPTKANYKLIISFQTEQQRLQWVATSEHQRLWPKIEETLTGMKFNAMLYEEA